MSRVDRHKSALTAETRQHGLRRIHHSPLFWAGFFLFLLAIAIYVLSDDLSWVPVVH
jgi:hypothetical protein